MGGVERFVFLSETLFEMCYPFFSKSKGCFFYRELVAVISNFTGWGILKIMSTNISVTDRQNVVIYCFDLLTSKSSQ